MRSGCGRKRMGTMNLNDMLEIEQLKYCYEQAYALHRHTDIPDLFVQETDTVFTLPSAGDRTVGWDVINEKFCHELYHVSPNEDSFHTGWQISAPLLWEGADGEICGIFPTFGFLVLSMDPVTMKPPYPVLSTLELWQDRFAKRDGRWRIHYLQAQFLLGQCVWRWNAPEDKGLAVQKKLREIPHPVLGRQQASGTAAAGKAGKAAAGSFPGEKTSGKEAFGSVLYGVQSAMSLYTLLWQCGRIKEIPKHVFCDAKDVCVWYDGQERAEGRAEVEAFFEKNHTETAANGGFLRIDMPATQWIEIMPDGQAEGHFMTQSRQIIRSEAGSQYRVMIGRFSNSFCRQDGIWKLKSVRWEKLQEFAPYAETPDVNLESYRKNPAGWLAGLPALKPVSGEGVSGRTEEILLLRNEILSWFYEAGSGAKPEEKIPSASSEVSTAVRETFRECRYILATSPVLEMDDSLTEAEAFFSVSLLAGSGEDEMIYTRGSIGMTLQRTSRSWEVSRFSWYPYASLDRWKNI